MLDMEARASFPQILKGYMDRDGLTQVDISKRLNVSKQTVSDWLLGKKFPRVDRMQALANLFNMQALANLFNVLMSDMYTPASDRTEEITSLSGEEKYLVRLWRNAEPAVREIVIENLENHQKKDTKQSAI